MWALSVDYATVAYTMYVLICICCKLPVAMVTNVNKTWHMKRWSNPLSYMHIMAGQKQKKKRHTTNITTTLPESLFIMSCSF